MGFAIMTFSGKPEQTTRVVVGDSVGNLASIFTNSSGRPAVGVLLTCEASDLRFTLGGDITAPSGVPTQGTSGLGHVLANGQSLFLPNGSTVRTFQFIAYTAGVSATLQITPMFERG